MATLYSSKRFAILILLAIIACGCSGSPVAPTTPDPIDLASPVSLTISATSGMNNQAGTATITAKVQGPNGVALRAISVAFATDAGTLSATASPTDQSGIASTTLTSDTAATVTARVGALSAKALVSAEPHTAAAPPDVPPVLLPPPAPVVPPKPQPGYIVTIMPSASSVIASNTLTLTATAFPLNGAPTATSFAWDCLGDGATIVPTSTPAMTCTYPTAGSVTTRLTVSAAGAASSGSTPITVVAGLVALVSCAPVTPAVPGKLACSANVTYGGVGLPSAAITNVAWDWGDGNTGTTTATSPNTATHQYVTGGQTLPVIATVTATTVNGAKTAIGTTIATTPP